MVRTFCLSRSLRKRAIATAFSIILGLEGSAWLTGTFPVHRDLSSSIARNFTLAHGAINIFCAALVASDATAIHLHNISFYVASTFKIIYLLFSAALGLMMQIADGLDSPARVWLATRIFFTLIWIYGYTYSLVSWTEQVIPLIPSQTVDDASSMDSDSGESSWRGGPVDCPE